MSSSWSHLEVILKSSWSHLEVIMKSSWSHHELNMKSSWSFHQIWDETMKILSSKTLWTGQTDRQKKISSSWAPVRAKNVLSYGVAGGDYTLCGGGYTLLWTRLYQCCDFSVSPWSKIRTWTRTWTRAWQFLTSDWPHQRVWGLQPQCHNWLQEEGNHKDKLDHLWINHLKSLEGLHQSPDSRYYGGGPWGRAYCYCDQQCWISELHNTIQIREVE